MSFSSFLQRISWVSYSCDTYIRDHNGSIYQLGVPRASESENIRTWFYCFYSKSVACSLRPSRVVHSPPFQTRGFPPRHCFSPGCAGYAGRGGGYLAPTFSSQTPPSSDEAFLLLQPRSVYRSPTFLQAWKEDEGAMSHQSSWRWIDNDWVFPE